MILDVGHARRSVRGDVTSPQRDSVRTRLLGHRRTDFNGLEVGLTMIYNQIPDVADLRAAVGKVDGLTRGQLVALVDLRAPFRTKLLKRD